MKSNYLITIILVLVFGAGSFFAGMKYQESKQSSLRQSAFGSGANGQLRNRMAGNVNGIRPVSGEIISSDKDSITVKLQDNSSKIILLSDKTVINKAEQATLNDLKTGEKVAVFGTENSDGSISAQNIQLNPLGRYR